MAIQVCIDLLVILIVIYYFSIILHLFGINIFSKKELLLGKAAIPFYYWFREPKESEKKELSFEEKVTEAENAVLLAKKQMEDLSSEAGTETSEAKQKLNKAKKIHEKALKNLELLKQTKF